MMRKYRYDLYAFLLLGLFYFSEGKPCPERTRPHRTRCDAYYKCTEIESDKHVWVPTRCEEGLVYEHSLEVCVLPADDWECSLGEHRTATTPNATGSKATTKVPSSNKDADIYIVSNADNEDEDNVENKNYNEDDDRVEIIIGDNLSDEDKAEENDEGLFDGSGNGGELVELDGFMPAQNRETEEQDLPASKTIEDEDRTKKHKKEVEKVEQKEELEEMIHTIKTKSEIGQPSSNIDPNLTAQLQRLSQLIDGLKQTYQSSDDKQQNALDSLRPDQLNAFLAHFNIKNKFDTLDPSESFTPNPSTTTTTPKTNRTLNYKQDFTTKLNPETKVVLSNILPQRYNSNDRENNNSGGGYSNSQIVVNRPEGSVLFSLPGEQHFVEHPEYSSVNAPKISEETLKTVLELSKQMIAQQNVPKIIPNPTYFAPSIMQPILLTPQVDSPFSSNYLPQNSNGLSFTGHSPFSSAGYNQNYKYKKPGKRPQHNGSNNRYKGNENGGYGNDKPSTTIIHNNVIPVHVSTTNSGEKEVLDSYGQSFGLYPTHHEDRPITNTDYYGNSNSNAPYSSNYQNNEHATQTTKRPSYVSISTTSSSYETTSRPFNYQPTASTINQYFTPSEHLGDHNVNNMFPSVDNFGTVPRPMKGKRPNQQQIYKPTQDTMDNDNGYNQLFPQLDNHKVHVRPNSQNFESMENDNEDALNNYQDDNNDEETQLVTYTYGRKKKPAVQQPQFANYAESTPQSSLNSVFSTNNQYMTRPQSNAPNIMTSSSSHVLSANKNKYKPINSPISSSYTDGTQLVNVGGNFISFDVFQNSILPIIGGNPDTLSSGLNNIEVITCATGVRQPNTTDCTRYYVCSKKDGKVLSYSCPPYTAFNSEARICDARTYAMCTPNAPTPNYSVSENKRIQMETIKALQEAKRRQMLQQQQQKQQQAIKAQNFANLLQQYNSPSSNPSFTSISSPGQDSSELNMLNSYMQGQSFSTTPKPQLTTAAVKKRKYYCKEGDKIADQTSINNYFVCYKNAQGQMKGHKMTCSKGLLFCPKITMCTLPSKCS